MLSHKLVAWTGPTAVKEVADKLRYAGVAVSCEGTERVFVSVEGETPRAAEEAIAEKLRLTTLRWLQFNRVSCC